MFFIKMMLRLSFTLIASFIAAQVSAGTVHVAVASNFTKPMKVIAANFEEVTGHRALVSYGSSGKLLGQIRHGAPFEIFLSADQDKPDKVEADNLAVPNSRFTYAIGKLVLWSADENTVDEEGEVLKSDGFQHIAIANPITAPYGRAAIQTMETLELAETLKDKIVQGESISQTKEFVSSSNAELGFVALSQITKDGEITEGSAWQIPDDLYSPIKQDAILLKNGENNEAAKALYAYLKSDDVQAMIQSFGYDLVDSSMIKSDSNAK
jgi:molybdate transport system substrate-binding protein